MYSVLLPTPQQYKRQSNNDMKETIKDIIFKTSALLVLAGAILPLFVTAAWVPYIFAIGAAGMSIVRLTTPYKGKNTRLRRLVLIELFGTLMLLFASYLMFRGGTDWLVILTISVVLQVYTAFLIPHVVAQEKQEEEKGNKKR